MHPRSIFTALLHFVVIAIIIAEAAKLDAGSPKSLLLSVAIISLAVDIFGFVIELKNEYCSDAACLKRHASDVHLASSYIAYDDIESAWPDGIDGASEIGSSGSASESISASVSATTTPATSPNHSLNASRQVSRHLLRQHNNNHNKNKLWCCFGEKCMSRLRLTVAVVWMFLPAAAVLAHANDSTQWMLVVTIIILCLVSFGLYFVRFYVLPSSGSTPTTATLIWNSNETNTRTTDSSILASSLVVPNVETSGDVTPAIFVKDIDHERATSTQT